MKIYAYIFMLSIFLLACKSSSTAKVEHANTSVDAYDLYLNNLKTKICIK